MALLIFVLACGGPLLVCVLGVIAAGWLLNGGALASPYLGGWMVASALVLAAPLASGAAVHTLMRWSMKDENSYSLALLAALITFLGVLCSADGLHSIFGAFRGDLPSVATLLGGMRQLTWVSALSVCVVMGGVLLCEVPFRIVAATCGVREFGTAADSVRWVLSLLVLVCGWSLIDEEIAGTAQQIVSTILVRR